MTVKETISSQTSPAYSVASRYWRLRDKREGWWPWGWLLLLALLLVFLYGLFVTAPAIEDQTAKRVGQVLAGHGVSNFEVDADGQEVRIRATASDADSERLRALARDATCETWVAGSLVCPNSVHVEVRAAARSALPASPQVQRHHDFRFEKTGDSIALNGEVPDAKTRDQLIAAAKSHYANVTDSLRISGERPTDDYDWAARHALQVLFAMQSGNVNWTAGSLSAKGRTTAAKEAEVRRVFTSASHPDRLGAIDLEIAEDANRCNKAFAERLTASTIRFDTGSAKIAPESSRLIAQLAELAKACPIGLAVEGHTDNVGSGQFNRRLSQARAEAVVAALVDLGVDSARLSPRGFGADRPIADNSTLAGRAKNRRIEIRAIAP